MNTEKLLASGHVYQHSNLNKKRGPGKSTILHVPLVGETVEISHEENRSDRSLHANTRRIRSAKRDIEMSYITYAKPGRQLDERRKRTKRTKSSAGQSHESFRLASTSSFLIYVWKVPSALLRLWTRCTVTNRCIFHLSCCEISRNISIKRTKHRGGPANLFTYKRNVYFNCYAPFIFHHAPLKTTYYMCIKNKFRTKLYE